MEVKTHGSGAGIDRPAGVYPDLHMWWQPVYLPSCTFCAPRIAEGQPTFCVMDCPTQALAFGDADDPASPYGQALERCMDKGCTTFELPADGATKQGVVYAQK